MKGRTTGTEVVRRLRNTTTVVVAIQINVSLASTTVTTGVCRTDEVQISTERTKDTLIEGTNDVILRAESQASPHTTTREEQLGTTANKNGETTEKENLQDIVQEAITTEVIQMTASQKA